MGVFESDSGRSVDSRTTFRGSCSELTERILGCAFAIHARLGPGLLESTYKACLLHRLKLEGMEVECEVPIGIEFDGITIDTAYRADLIIEKKVLLELKVAERVLSIHCAQT